MHHIAGYAITPKRPEDRAPMVERLRADHWMVLDTCQRLEVFGVGEPPFEVDHRWSQSEAFERLVRIATGLESRILGELEVLGQVRNAYKQFQASCNAMPAGESGNDLAALDRMFQDVLALARKARKQSGIDQNLTSLSGLASREMLARVEKGAPIAVIGSGTLARSVVRYLSKRGESPVRVAGRCPDKALQLALEAGGFGVGLEELAHLLKGVHGVITATAAPHPVLYALHLCADDDHLLHVIDLGVPPDCCDATIAHERVDYVSLQDIEAKSESNLVARTEAAVRAREVIREHMAKTSF